MEQQLEHQKSLSVAVSILRRATKAAQHLSDDDAKEFLGNACSTLAPLEGDLTDDECIALLTKAFSPLVVLSTVGDRSVATTKALGIIWDAVISELPCAGRCGTLRTKGCEGNVTLNAVVISPRATIRCGTSSGNARKNPPGHRRLRLR